MKIGEFIKDKITILLVNILIFTVLVTILITINIENIIIFIIFCIWFLPLTSYMLIEFVNCKKYYNSTNSLLENLDKKYLLPEVMEDTEFIHAKKLNYILKEVSRDMHENVKHFKDIQIDYREYIETWVHEIKTPIASIMLLIENNQNEVTNKIDYQIDKVNGYVEQVLYYSRSNNVSNDYIIKHINLGDLVRNVVKRNYRDFIYKKIKLDIKDIDQMVYSDGKWAEFIINQILGNAIKYSIKKNSMIKIYTVKKNNSVALIIEDKGIGIVDKDIDKVFEKGFTGENGRHASQSTGMGLYLCKKLSFKLGLKITIDSTVDKGTKVTLIFPLSGVTVFTGI